MKENSHVFFCPEASDVSLGQNVFLSGDEAQHCSKVLRLKKDDKVVLIDGLGNEYCGLITESFKDAVSVLISEKKMSQSKRNYYNHVAIAPTKNIDRFEWFVEKAVEFGIDEITPLLCRYGERKVLKEDRIKKIIISAIKQSGNAVLPKLNPLTEFSSVVSSAKEYKKLIAYCSEAEKKSFFPSVVTKGENVLTLIGPEGDFSPDEVQTAVRNSFKPISLGNTRLRTETAGISVCAFLSCINNS